MKISTVFEIIFFPQYYLSKKTTRVLLEFIVLFFNQILGMFENLKLKNQLPTSNIKWVLLPMQTAG